MKRLFIYAIQLLTHPIDCCYFVKKGRKELPYWYGLFCLLLVALCRILSVYGTSYHLNSNLPEDSNIFVLLGIIILPGISWIVGAYSTTTLMGGETTFRELFTLGCLCYLPYILITPIQILVSHFLSGESTIIYQTIGTVAIIWVVILEFICFMRSNDYPFSKAFGVSIVSLVVVLLMWTFVLLSMVFVYQVIIFISELILEIRSMVIV